MAKMGEVINRISGISTPFGGISWTPGPDERKIIYKLLQQLGDRTLIRNYHGAYKYLEVIESIKIMRANLTTALTELDPESGAREIIEKVREILHVFQNYIEQRESSSDFESAWQANEWFVPVAAEMRKAVGSQLAILAKLHGITIPESLSGNFETGRP